MTGIMPVSDEEGTVDIMRINGSGDKKVSDLTPTKEDKRGASVYVRQGSILSNLVGEKQDEVSSKKGEGEKQMKRKGRKHKSYDKAARENFKMKMINQLQ